MTPRLTISINNPDILKKDDLIRGFVARQALRDRLIDDLRREGPGGSPQHQLIVGQRGFGKTTLLRRLAYAVEDDAELRAGWLPLVFPEEQYNVATLADFWLNCADTLSDALARSGEEDASGMLDGAIQAVKGRGEERTSEALRILVDAAERAGRKLLLLVDNIDIVFDRIGEEKEWDFRRTISGERRLHITGASSRTIEATYNYGRAFYDFFEIHHLKGLDDDEALAVLSRLAELSGNQQASLTIRQRRGRIKTMRLLTGGNPRTLVLLYRILAEDSGGDVQHDIEQLLDHYTPLYKARFEDLGAQAQVLVDAMAVHWYPLTAGDLHNLVSSSTLLTVNQVSAQLNRLEDLGVVEKSAWYGEDKPEKKTAFLIAERFFNIWYLMRASRRIRRKMVWLVKFLESWFDAEELKTHAREFLGRNPDSLGREHFFDVALAHSEAVHDKYLRRSLESAGLHAVLDDGVRRMIDFSDLPPELQERAARIDRVRRLRQTVLGLKIEWGGIDRQEFWRLLGGSPQYSLEEKARIVEKLAGMTGGEIEKLFAELQRSERQRLHFFPRQSDALARLYEALANGDVADVYDWEEFVAIAQRWGLPRLPYIAIRCRTNPSLGPRELSAEEFARAESACRSLAAERGFEAQGWMGIGDLFRDRLLRQKDAEVAYHRAIESDPNDPWAWYGLGFTLQELKRNAEAEAAYRQAVELDPDDGPSWLGLGILWRELKRFEEAEAAFRRSIELDPQSELRWDNLGHLLDDLNRGEEAEAAYRRAIELDTQADYAWHNLGGLLQRLGRFAEAEAACRRSVELDPSSAPLWSGLGNILFDLKRYEEAEEAYRRSIELDPRYAHPWNGLGLVLQRLNRTAEAEAAYRRSIELDPQSEYPWSNLGWLLGQDEGRQLEAAEAHRRAAEINPKRKRDLEQMLTLCAKAGDSASDREAALEILHRANQSIPGNRETQFVLAELLTKAGKWDDAKPLLGSLALQDLPSSLYEGFFRAVVEGGFAAEALAILERSGADERWRPLYEALRAARAGTSDYLRRVAPEVRGVAMKILRSIASFTVQE